MRYFPSCWLPPSSFLDERATRAIEGKIQVSAKETEETPFAGISIFLCRGGQWRDAQTLIYQRDTTRSGPEIVAVAVSVVCFVVPRCFVTLPRFPI